MQVAFVVAKRSVCVRSKVGAVIVSPQQRVISTGYNGQPAGMPAGSACSEWCPRSRKPEDELAKDYTDCRSIHAEMNALMYSNRSDHKDGTLYVTTPPCWTCGKAISNSGIKRVVIVNKDDAYHRDPDKTINFMRDSGLAVTAYIR
jgi:dCMP deaminase